MVARDPLLEKARPILDKHDVAYVVVDADVRSYAYVRRGMAENRIGKIIGPTGKGWVCWEAPLLSIPYMVSNTAMRIEKAIMCERDGKWKVIALVSFVKPRTHLSPEEIAKIIRVKCS